MRDSSRIGLCTATFGGLLATALLPSIGCAVFDGKDVSEREDIPIAVRGAQPRLRTLPAAATPVGSSRVETDARGRLWKVERVDLSQWTAPPVSPVLAAIPKGTKSEDLTDEQLAETARPIGIQFTGEGETFAWTLLSDLSEEWLRIAKTARAKARAGVRGRGDPLRPLHVDEFAADEPMPPPAASDSASEVDSGARA